MTAKILEFRQRAEEKGSFLAEAIWFVVLISLIMAGYLLWL